MGNSDDHGGGDRWRGERDRGRGDGNRYGEDRGRGGQDGGFFERAGEQVRSWFGDDDDHSRRSGGGGQSSDRDRDYGRPQRWSGDDSFGGGWGNQAMRPDWSRSDRERPSELRGNWGGGHDDRSRAGGDRGGSGAGAWGGETGRQHDPHYSEWRRRQIEELDRDYEEYHRENRSRFEQEFTGWREKRQGQRQSMGRVAEQMEVIGSDGQHLGKVDKVSGGRIILAKNDPNAGGHHHSVPCSWIERVDSQVHVNRSAEQAMREWQDEERSRALVEREDSGSPGPHMLNRSFSGTYRDPGDDR
jgi:hypothetical protein